jgi:hypothetical protein
MWLKDNRVGTVSSYGSKGYPCSRVSTVTIYNYSALFTLSGQLKGKGGCVVCIDGTAYVYIYLFVCVNVYIIQFLF